MVPSGAGQPKKQIPPSVLPVGFPFGIYPGSILGAILDDFWEAKWIKKNDEKTMDLLMHFGLDLEVILEGFWSSIQENLEACVRCSKPMKVLALPANLISGPVLDEPETSQNRYQIFIEKYIQKICAN